MRKIYPREWVSMHPYTKTDATDNYYCKLVNRIIELLYDYDIMEGETEPEDEVYEDILFRRPVSGRYSLRSAKNAMAADCLSMNLAKIIIPTR